MVQVVGLPLWSEWSSSWSLFEDLSGLRPGGCFIIASWPGRRFIGLSGRLCRLLSHFIFREHLESEQPEQFKAWPAVKAWRRRRRHLASRSGRASKLRRLALLAAPPRQGRRLGSCVVCAPSSATLVAQLGQSFLVVVVVVAPSLWSQRRPVASSSSLVAGRTMAGSALIGHILAGRAHLSADLAAYSVKSRRFGAPTSRAND